MTPETGSFDGVEHVYPVRVYYDDTDAAGVVYYANYLRMAERARTEMLRLIGADHAAMAASDGVVLAVRECTIEYLSPARLDDALEIRTRLIEARGASLRAEQIVRRADSDLGDLARIRLRLACVRDTGQPARLPPSFRATQARFESDFMPAQKQRA